MTRAPHKPAAEQQTDANGSAGGERAAKQAHLNKPVDTGTQMLRNSDDDKGKKASEHVAKVTSAINDAVAELEAAPQGEHDRMAARQLRDSLRDALNRAERFVTA